MPKSNHTTTKESYSYDAVGNRLSSLGVSPYSYNSSNELTSKPAVTYAYDNNGSLASKTDSTGTSSYTWDFENRLTKITFPGGGTVSFQYDPLGRRIQKVSSSGTTNYIYDGANVIEEASSSGSALIRYSRTLGIDDLLSELNSRTISYYEANGVGSITSLSNSSGSLANTYTYDSFGNTTASTGTTANNYRYTGREFDSETGLYYYRARYYDPSIGRFISDDPLGFGGGINFYRYVGNNPINLIDPLGLCDKDKTKDCIARALQALFPGVTSAVADPVGNPNGGHYNFPVQLTFPSSDAADAFLAGYSKQGSAGFAPDTRYTSDDKLGIGTTLHLENLLNKGNRQQNSNGAITLTGKAHIDLYDPDTGLAGIVGHSVIDGLIGHIGDLLGQNIDPENCPW